MNKSRIVGIDVFRFLAAFSVILVHVGNYSALPSFVRIELRLLARWAVPFFFIVSGYFVAPYVFKGFVKFIDISSRILAIFFVSNILFIPLCLHKTGVISTLEQLISFNLITEGMAGHLWYLSSLSVAMLIFYTLLSYDALKIISSLVIGCFIILVVVAYHPIYHQSSWVFARYIMSFFFIYIGILFRLKKINLKVKSSVLLICFGIISQTLEAYLLDYLFETNPLKHDFLLGTIPFATGMFLLSLKIPDSENVGKLAVLGIKYSLGIYIFHPYFIYFIQLIEGRVDIDDRLMQVIIVPLSFLFTFLFLIVLNRYCPFLLRLISGDPTEIKKIDRGIPLPAAIPKLHDK